MDFDHLGQRSREKVYEGDGNMNHGSADVGKALSGVK
jgi:hypothetical protein